MKWRVILAGSVHWQCGAFWENVMGVRRWTFVEEAVPARVAWAGQFTLGLLATLCIVASALIIYLR